MLRAATVEKTLQLTTYRAVLASDRSAIRDVLKMIEVWNKALTAKQQTASDFILRSERGDPDNAFEALMLLNTAIEDTNWDDHENNLRLVLQPWNVDMAHKRLQRSRSRKSNNKTGKHNTGEPESIPLPECCSECAKRKPRNPPAMAAHLKQRGSSLGRAVIRVSTPRIQRTISLITQF